MGLNSKKIDLYIFLYSIIIMKKVNIRDRVVELEDSTALIHCKDLKDYLDNSDGLAKKIGGHMVGSIFSLNPFNRFRNVLYIEFEIDNLLVEKVWDSFYEKIEDDDMLLPLSLGITVTLMYIPGEIKKVAITRRNYILSDGKDNLSAYVDIPENLDWQDTIELGAAGWARIGHKVNIEVSPFYKEGVQDIYIYQLNVIN